jgi:thiol-disulfide isomerase/thioredoxin
MMPMRLGTPMPSLDGATEWVNGGPVTAEELRGQPTLIHFWAVSCHSCHDMMPALRQWRDQYAPQGLQVISIHQPRSEADLDLEAAKQAIHENNLVHPVALDHSYAIVDAWENKFVPAFYLFDSEGKLRHYQAGDRGQRMIQQAIERVLAAAAAAPTSGG